MSGTSEGHVDAEVQRVLAERAAAFAKPVAKRVAAGAEVVIFRVLYERFALQLSAVVEFVRITTLTPLPGAARPVAGVVAWRGRAVLIIDFAYPPRAEIAIGEETRVIMVGEAGHVIGFIADEVEDVTRIDVSAVTQTPSESWRGQVIRGLSAGGILILDPAQLMRRFAAPSTPPSR